MGKRARLRRLRIAAGLEVIHKYKGGTMATAAEVQKALTDTIQKMGWTAPTFFLIYESPDSVKFGASWHGTPSEGQFQIAGQ